MKIRREHSFSIHSIGCTYVVVCILVLCLAAVALSSCAGYVADNSSVTPPASPSLAITTHSVTAAVQNSAYSFSFEATEGISPYTWAIMSGNLPAGLQLSAAGLLSGTPTVAGSANFTVGVTDSAQHSASEQLGMMVQPSSLNSSQPQDSVTIFEVDRINQNNRPITFGRVFKEGEIPGCPQPIAGGNSPYQVDVQNRWSDGSVKFAIVSFIQTLAANSATDVEFQNTTSCNNAAYLTQGQMLEFNGGHWDAQIVVTAPGSRPVRTSAKSMLAASDPGANTLGDCRNDYWLKGPVVTAVIVQDCTAAMSADFGWEWNGIAMGSNSGYAYTARNPYASNHPMFILYFYPSINAVECEEILELPWTGKRQDQLEDLAFYTENSSGALVERWSRIGARMITDAVVAAVNANNPPVLTTETITSNSANFTSTDIGLPFCYLSGGYDSCGRITAVSSPTQITVTYPLFGGGGGTGSGLTAYFDLQAARTRHRKVFWSGTAPGHIRIGHNFGYLVSTKALPCFDWADGGSSSVCNDSASGVFNQPNPTHGYYENGKCCGAWAYSNWANTDMGEIGGFAEWNIDYAAVVEGRPLMENELRYLYHMDDQGSGVLNCGQPNSYCAMAWDMLTGEVDSNPLTTLVGVTGGGGDYSNFGNVPIWYRESRTSADNGYQLGSANCFYVSQFENKNGLGAATQTFTSQSACLGGGDANVSDPTGPNTATGKALSTYAHASGVPAVGSTLPGPGGWELSEIGLHYLDPSYLAYLLTGSPFYLENQEMSASYAASNFSDNGLDAQYGAGAFWGFINVGGAATRIVWGLQSVARAAYIAPDGSAEQAYYKSILLSNLEIEEGFQGVTGTLLTPTSPAPQCTGTSCSYNATTATRWDWGAATVRSQCVQTSTSSCSLQAVSALHMLGIGSCPIDGSDEQKGADWITSATYYFNDVVRYPEGTGTMYQSLANNNTAAPTNTTYWESVPATAAPASTYGGPAWMYGYAGIVYGETAEMFPSFTGVAHVALKSFVERTLDSTYNPYMLGMAYAGDQDSSGGTTCAGGANQDPFIQTYARLLASIQPPQASNSNFNANGVTPSGGYWWYGTFPCDDHGYSLVSRAALSFAPEFGVSSTDQGTGAQLTASAAWTWASAYIPYFDLGPAGTSVACSSPQIDPTYTTTTDRQIKFAIVPRSQ